MGFVGRKPTNAPLTADDIPNGIISAADLASGISGLITWQSVQTSGFTAVSGRGYWINTTSNACTVTLPASATAGDTIILVDYARKWGTNAVTINQNSLNFQGNTSPNPIYNTNGQSVTLVYSGATLGWIPTVDDDVTNETPQSYTADFLVIAGGGGGSSNRGSGGGGAGGYRNSYSTETSGGGGSSETSLTFSPGTVYTVTVGAGGSAVGSNIQGNNGVNSSISGTGLSTLTSIGGGGGGQGGTGANGSTGGSGGGNGSASGTANQGYAGGTGVFTYEQEGGGGGGGASAIGGNGSARQGGAGGNGLASSITGSSITRAGGGGGGCSQQGTNTSAGGSGGGGGGTASTGAGGNGTVNTGSGGGAAGDGANNSGSGGSGVVILRMPTANYSGTTTGSPTVTTSGADTILVYNASGSYTG